MGKCAVCGAEELLPFTCKYCGQSFCPEHRLPENHGCGGITLARRPEEIRVRTWKVEYLRRSRAALFTREEMAHLLVATVVVVLAGVSLLGFAFTPTIYYAALLLGFAASFLGHELAHKIVALRKGFGAEFRVYFAGLLVTVLTAVLPIPFKVIMPGAVVIRGIQSLRDMGQVALAGPLFNMVVAAVSLAVGRLLGSGFLFAVASLNAFLMFFNMLPIMPLDGEKVFIWSRKVWTVVFVLSLGVLTLARLL
ncbi:MAG: AN1-type zinc finger domain-containing protein [Candidatus Caldarchaeum sp.]